MHIAKPVPLPPMPPDQQVVLMAKPVAVHTVSPQPGPKPAITNLPPISVRMLIHQPHQTWTCTQTLGVPLRPPPLLALPPFLPLPPPAPFPPSQPHLADVHPGPRLLPGSSPDIVSVNKSPPPFCSSFPAPLTHHLHPLPQSLLNCTWLMSSAAHA